MGFITIFGGTFNPIHIGHCEIIRELSANPLVDSLILIPTKIPPHKSSAFLASAEHRYKMCEIIANDYNNVTVSSIELYREGLSYTIDTVNSLIKLYPNRDIALTIGGDMLVSFSRWKDYLQLLKKCTLFVFKRTDVTDVEYTDAIKHLTDLGAKIVEINKTITDISSTEIRNSLSLNKHCFYLDPRINDYIQNNNLYGV